MVTVHRVRGSGGIQFNFSILIAMTAGGLVVLGLAVTEIVPILLTIAVRIGRGSDRREIRPVRLQPVQQPRPPTAGHRHHAVGCCRPGCAVRIADSVGVISESGVESPWRRPGPIAALRVGLRHLGLCWPSRTAARHYRVYCSRLPWCRILIATLIAAHRGAATRGLRAGCPAIRDKRRSTGQSRASHGQAALRPLSPRRGCRPIPTYTCHACDGRDIVRAAGKFPPAHRQYDEFAARPQRRPQPAQRRRRTRRA